MQLAPSFRAARRRLLRLAAAGALAAGTARAAPVAPAATPPRSWRLVVSAAGADAVARTLAAQLGAALGVPVQVELRAGATGTESVARAVGDGQTLLLAHTGTLALHGVQARAAAPKAGELLALGAVAALPQVLLVPTAGPIENVPELLLHARFGNARLALATAGVGSAGHLAGELLQELAGVKLQHVPYKGVAQALTELLAAQVDLMFAPLPAAQPQLDAGRVRALAVTGARRSAALPAVPTLAEAGVKGYECAPALLLLAPRALPPEAAAPLSAALARTLDGGPLREALRLEGAEPLHLAGAELAALLQAEHDKWGRLAARAAARPES